MGLPNWYRAWSRHNPAAEEKLRQRIDRGLDIEALSARLSRQAGVAQVQARELLQQLYPDRFGFAPNLDQALQQGPATAGQAAAGLASRGNAFHAMLAIRGGQVELPSKSAGNDALARLQLDADRAVSSLLRKGSVEDAASHRLFSSWSAPLTQFELDGGRYVESLTEALDDPRYAAHDQLHINIDGEGRTAAAGRKAARAALEEAVQHAIGRQATGALDDEDAAVLSAELLERFCAHCQADGINAQVVAQRDGTCYALIAPEGQHPANKLAARVKRSLDVYLIYAPGALLENDAAGVFNADSKVIMIGHGDALSLPRLQRSTLHEISHARNALRLMDAAKPPGNTRRRNSPYLGFAEAQAGARLAVDGTGLYTTRQSLDEINAYAHTVRHAVAGAIHDLERDGRIGDQTRYDLLSFAGPYYRTALQSAAMLTRAERALERAQVEPSFERRDGVVWARLELGAGDVGGPRPKGGRAAHYTLQIPLIDAEAVDAPGHWQALLAQVKWARSAAADHLNKVRIVGKALEKLTASSSATEARALLRALAPVLGDRDLAHGPGREVMSFDEAVTRFNARLARELESPPLAA